MDDVVGYIKDLPLSLHVSEIVDGIMNRRMFGAVLCDLRVPDHLRSFYRDFPPIVKRAKVDWSEQCDITKARGEATGQAQKIKELLVASYFADEYLVTTKMLRWYVDHGVEVTKIRRVILSQPRRTFAPFVRLTNLACCRAQLDPSSAPEAQLRKLCGNAVVGKFAERFDRVSTKVGV